MISFLKARSLQKEAQQRVSNRDVSQINSRLSALGIIVNGAENFEKDLPLKIAKSLGSEEVNYKILQFKEKQNPKIEDTVTTLYKSQIKWSGQVNNKTAQEFLNTPFEVLISLNSIKNIYIDALVAKSNAHFKIGFTNYNQPIYDLILNIPLTDYKLLINELVKYLTLLKKI